MSLTNLSTQRIRITLLEYIIINYIGKCYNIKNSGIIMLRSLKHMRILNLSFTNISEYLLLKLLMSLKTLKKLTLGNGIYKIDPRYRYKRSFKNKMRQVSTIRSNI